MVITVICPRLSCRAVLRVPDTVRGKRVRCCGCGTAFIVPPPSGAHPQRNKPTREQAAK